MKTRYPALRLFPKKLGRRHIERLINARVAARGRRRILDAARSNSVILLESVLFGPGNVEHYYHLLFDLIYPLHVLIQRAPANSMFLVEKRGPYTDLAELLFPNNVRTVAPSDIPNGIERRPLPGLDPWHVCSTRGTLQTFCTAVQNRLNIRPADRPDQVLLIERLPPDDYFLNRAELKGAGSSRRSILNHNDLRQALKAAIKKPLEFHNL